MNTENLNNEIGYCILMKGPPKEGKSIAAHSFPKTYTFDFDRKIRMVKNWAKGRSDYAQDFDYDTFDDIVLAKKKCEEFKRSCPYETLIVDGVTEAANTAIRCMINYRNPNWQDAPLIKSKNSDKTIRAGIPMTEIEDFNGESRFLSDLVDDLKVIREKHGTNIIVCAHVITTTVTDIQGRQVSETKKLITMGNKIGASLPGKFDEVLHFDRQTSIDPNEKPRFLCYARDHNGNGAGTSLTQLPDVIDWTDASFYKKLQMYVKGDIF